MIKCCFNLQIYWELLSNRQIFESKIIYLIVLLPHGNVLCSYLPNFYFHFLLEIYCKAFCGVWFSMQFVWFFLWRFSCTPSELVCRGSFYVRTLWMGRGLNRYLWFIAAQCINVSLANILGYHCVLYPFLWKHISIYFNLCNYRNLPQSSIFTLFSVSRLIAMQSWFLILKQRKYIKHVNLMWFVIRFLLYIHRTRQVFMGYSLNHEPIRSPLDSVFKIRFDAFPRVFLCNL